MRYTPAIPSLVIVLFGVLLYGHTLHAPWYLDDYRVIVGNPRLTDFPACLTSVFAPRGVSVASFSLNHYVGGLDPVGYHVVNITIHLLATWLVFLLLRRLLKCDSRQLPLLGALLFLAHPVQTQAITYVVQRMTSLAGMLLLLSLYLFIQARDSLDAGHSWRSRHHLLWYGSSCVAASLALFAKESTIVLPLLLILVSRLGLGTVDRGWKAELTYVAPYFIPVLFLAGTIIQPLLSGRSLVELARTNAVAIGAQTTPLDYLVTQFTVLWIYVRLLFLPYGQALDHAYPIVATHLSIANLVALSGLILLAGLAWYFRGRRPLLALGIGWFFLTLAVESSIIPLDPLFEHRLYLPVFGFTLVLCELTANFFSRPLHGLTALILMVLAFSWLTWQRNALWTDPVALHEDNFRKVPRSARVAANLSKAYSDQRRYAEAERVARIAVALNPRYEIAQYNLGVALYYLDRYVEAQGAFDNALKLKSDYADALYAAALCAIEQNDVVLSERLSIRMSRLDPTRGAKLRQKIADRSQFWQRR